MLTNSLHQYHQRCISRRCVCVYLCVSLACQLGFCFVSYRVVRFRLYKGTFPHGHMHGSLCQCVCVCEWYAAKAATKQTQAKRLKRSLGKAKLNSSCHCCCCFGGDVGFFSSGLSLPLLFSSPHHPSLLKHFCLFQRRGRICISDVGWLVRSAHWQPYLYLPGTFCPLRVRSVLFYALLPRLLCEFRLETFFVFRFFPCFSPSLSLLAQKVAKWNEIKTTAYWPESARQF